MDCVVERAEVWRDLFLEVAGEEAEGFFSKCRPTAMAR